MQVTIILGLCGSGKTYRANELAAETGARNFEHVASDAEVHAELLGHLRAGGIATVEEVTYCDPVPRAKFEDELTTIKGLEIVWECFENNRAKADSNVINRTDKQGGGTVADHLQYNRALETIYTYPDGAAVLSIHVIDPTDARA